MSEGGPCAVRLRVGAASTRFACHSSRYFTQVRVKCPGPLPLMISVAVCFELELRTPPPTPPGADALLLLLLLLLPLRLRLLPLAGGCSSIAWMRLPTSACCATLAISPLLSSTAPVLLKPV